MARPITIGSNMALPSPVCVARTGPSALTEATQDCTFLTLEEDVSLTKCMNACMDGWLGGWMGL